MAALIVVMGLVALAGTTVVSSALPGRIGAPETTTPVAERAAPDQPLTRLAVLGDVGTGEPDAYAVADKLTDVGASDPFDGLILLGDNVYPDGDAARLDATVFTPYADVLDAGADLLPVLGNHDAGFAAEQVEALGMPDRWYATQLDDVLFIGLDSTIPEDPTQLAWLERTLATATADWIVAGLHHPPFSAGVHGSDEEVRETFVPLFEKYGVDLVLAGHDHDYQRSIPIGGVTYVVSGAGAKVRSTGTADFTAESAAVLHFVELAVWDDRIDITAISLDGIFDQASVKQDVPMSLPASAFPIEGLVDEDLVAGAIVAAIAFGVWMSTILAARFLPVMAVVRAEKVIVFASTLAVLGLAGGLGTLTIELVA